MEKKYQLVAWTKNIADKENARLYAVPSLEQELQGPFIDEICRCRGEEESNGYISLELAERFVRAYEQAARFELLTGHIDQAIRLLFLAADYCIYDEDNNWLCYDSNLGRSYYCVCGELRHEFARLCEEAVSLAGKYGFEYVLNEDGPKRIREMYLEDTRYERDLKRHLKEVSAWLKSDAAR